MVYIHSWTDFETAATDLYAKSPRKVRYCVTFKPKTGQLILRLTDDTTCIKYKTFSAIILNRFESLNTRLLSQIANIKPRTRLAVPTTGEQATSPGAEQDDPMNGTGQGRNREETPAPDNGGAAAKATPGGGGGGKKKKKGKR